MDLKPLSSSGERGKAHVHDNPGYELNDSAFDSNSR